MSEAQTPPPAGTETPTTPAAAPPPAAPPSTPDSTPARPDWLPEGFADGAALAARYTELTTGQAAALEAAKAEAVAALRAGVPEKPDGYQISVPKDLLPEGFTAQIPTDDPFLAQMRTTFHELGAKPEQFQAAAEAFLRYQVAAMPDVVAERAKLGEGAPERLAAVDGWLAKTLAPGEYKAVANGLVTAEGVTAIEKLMKAAQGGALQGVPGGQAGPISADQASAILANPAYRQDTPEGRALREQFQRFVVGGGKLAGFGR